MVCRIDDLGSEDFNGLFRDFEHTAFRLETLQDYSVGYEDGSFEAFCAGRQMGPDEAKDEWTAIIADAAALGKKMSRVHVVVEPWTQYIDYELSWSYPPNVAAGESIGIIPVGSDDPWPAALPRWDYWLFDSRNLWRMNYENDGAFQFAELVEDSAEIVRCGHWRDVAVHAAVPYDSYMRRVAPRPVS
jgi:hypothetical protein